MSSEHELESFKTQVAILNESMNVKRVRLPSMACTYRIQVYTIHHICMVLAAARDQHLVSGEVTNSTGSMAAHHCRCMQT